MKRTARPPGPLPEDSALLRAQPVPSRTSVCRARSSQPPGFFLTNCSCLLGTHCVLLSLTRAPPAARLGPRGEGDAASTATCRHGSLRPELLSVGRAPGASASAHAGDSTGGAQCPLHTAPRRDSPSHRAPVSLQPYPCGILISFAFSVHASWFQNLFAPSVFIEQVCSAPGMDAVCFLLVSCGLLAM